MNEQQKQRLLKRILMGSVATILLGGAYFAGVFQFSQKDTSETQPLPPSEPIFNRITEQNKKDNEIIGTVEFDRSSIDIGDIVANSEKFSGSVSIKAKDTPITITKIGIPFADDIGVILDPSQCTGDDKDLLVGESCVLGVIYNPMNAGKLDARIIVSGLSTTLNGDKRNFTASLPISGYAKEPPKIPEIPPPEKSMTDQVNALAVALNRRASNLLAIQMTEEALLHMPPQRPQSSDWTDIGYNPNLSTYPMDMSRVVTMDKPIPAVIKYPIDTRNAARAVATVERDIYGNDGRTIVIDRGSNIIGTVGSISSTGEEKVAISWERIVRPDGAAFAIAATSGDAMGRAGVVAHIDNRWPERFGTQLLITAMNIGTILALNAENVTSTSVFGTQTSNNNARSQATEQLRSDITGLQKEYFREQMTLPPIRTIPVGTRITIWPTTDLWLKPIDPNDQMREQYENKVKASAAYKAAMQAAGKSPDMPPTPTSNLSTQPIYNSQISPQIQLTNPNALIPTNPGPVPPQNWTQMPSASERLQQNNSQRQSSPQALQQAPASPWFQYVRP